MDIYNVELYLRDNHAKRILLTYRTVKKFYLNIELVRLDIHFLKSCRRKGIIPKFLQSKTPNRNLASSSTYKDNQRRLLNAEIDHKYEHFNQLKKMYRSSTTTLQQFCSGDLFDNLQNIITTISRPDIEKKTRTVENKLYHLSLRVPSKHVADRQVVKNLSTRILSNDELDCLANGLDYGLVPKRFDEMSAVGNIEQFFHRVTDIFQHHKKLMTDLKDKDTVISNDLRVLDTKEMTLASNLRSLTDSFQYQADRYRRQQYMIRGEQHQYHQLLKRLKQDPSIIITRPDKGRGVVLMDKNDYITKMNVILADSTKFKCLFDDPTMTRERSLTYLLRRLKNKGYISDQVYNMARPTGSIPGRLYGLPKIHKDSCPLRPVLSSIGTYNYRLAKVLKQMLSTMIENVTIIKDSFGFVNELKSLPKPISEYKMVSFDITSLYTNIPVTDTIDIILNYLYDIEAPPSSAMKRNDMRKLLEFATQKSHFLFDGKVYDQIDGVSMGSPLAPLLAEIFLQDFEKKHQELFKEIGILYWKRYVDDTFVLLDSSVSAEAVSARLSQCHSAVKFTYEEERLPTEDDLKKWDHLKTNSSTTYLLSFLDVLVERQAGIGFETTIYRKPTFSGLTTKWDSFVPKRYKYNAVSSVAYRATRICSTNEALAEEFDKIRQIFKKNGYPIHFVESVIRRQLNLIYAPRAITATTQETDLVVLRVPYYGKPSHIYAKRVTAAVTKQYPSKQVRVVYDVKARIGQNFTTKDIISNELKSGVIYEATCPSCNDTYIGKTCRHLKTRINEHLSDQKKFMTTSLPPPEIQLNENEPHGAIHPIINDHVNFTSATYTMEQVSSKPELLPKPSSLPTAIKPKKSTFKTNKVQKKKHMTASQNKKITTITTNLGELHLDDLLIHSTPVENKRKDRVPQSAITKHYIATGHIFKEDHFKILLSDPHRYRLLIKESMLIKKNKPVLNETVRSMPLYIYPDRISTTHQKVIKTNKRTTCNTDPTSGIPTKFIN